MQLDEYLFYNRLSIRGFAKKAGVGYVTIYNYINRKKRCQLETIKRIYTATEGKVDITQDLEMVLNKKTWLKKHRKKKHKALK